VPATESFRTRRSGSAISSRRMPRPPALADRDARARRIHTLRSPQSFAFQTATAAGNRPR